MATLAKRKQMKASIMVFSSISKRSEIIFEAKRTPSILKEHGNEHKSGIINDVLLVCCILGNVAGREG